MEKQDIRVVLRDKTSGPDTILRDKNYLDRRNVIEKAFTSETIRRSEGIMRHNALCRDKTRETRHYLEKKESILRNMISEIRHVLER